MKEVSTRSINSQINILGIKVDVLTINQLHCKIEKLIINKNKSIVANVNVHALNLAFNRLWLIDFFNSASVTFCDGAGVILGAKLLGHKIPVRITYADWIWEIGKFSAQKNFSFYFLGAKEGVAAKAAEQLTERFPDIQIVGVHHGYFDKKPGSNENDQVISKINEVNPDVLVLGFGMPLQERWLYENWDRIDANIALTGGAVFDYVSGELKRGPKWMTNNGFEWLARLLIEPKRLWKRYIIGNPLFLIRILFQRLGIIKF